MNYDKRSTARQIVRWLTWAVLTGHPPFQQYGVGVWLADRFRGAATRNRYRPPLACPAARSVHDSGVFLVSGGAHFSGYERLDDRLFGATSSSASVPLVRDRNASVHPAFWFDPALATLKKGLSRRPEPTCQTMG